MTDDNKVGEIEDGPPGNEDYTNAVVKGALEAVRPRSCAHGPRAQFGGRASSTARSTICLKRSDFAISSWST
jgi:hypothetical protein